MNGAILTNATAVDRNKTDFYPTPHEATIALLKYLNIPKRAVIWEPACGQGHIAKVLKQFEYKVVSSELYNHGYGMTGIDFLQTKDFYRSEWIITNPPFSLSEEFILKCISYQIPFALLLKAQYWHSAKRRKLFEEYTPSHILPLTWRPDFLFGAKKGSPTMDCIWTVWGNKSAPQTIYVPLQKPKQCAVP